MAVTTCTNVTFNQETIEDIDYIPQHNLQQLQLQLFTYYVSLSTWACSVHRTLSTFVSAIRYAFANYFSSYYYLYSVLCQYRLMRPLLHVLLVLNRHHWNRAVGYVLYWAKINDNDNYDDDDDDSIVFILFIYYANNLSRQTRDLKSSTNSKNKLDTNTNKNEQCLVTGMECS